MSAPFCKACGGTRFVSVAGSAAVFAPCLHCDDGTARSELELHEDLVCCDGCGNLCQDYRQEGGKRTCLLCVWERLRRAEEALQAERALVVVLTRRAEAAEYGAVRARELKVQAEDSANRAIARMARGESEACRCGFCDGCIARRVRGAR